MALIRVTNVNVLNNPAGFLDPLQFEITFEALKDLPEDTEWKIIYIGSAESEQYDQILDTVLVGPVPLGSLKFVFQAEAPHAQKIPAKELLGVTVVLLTCSYRSQEFIRIGYYVNVEYTDPQLQEEPPSVPDYTKLCRNILAAKPRVTRFPINWLDDQSAQPAPSSSEPVKDEQLLDDVVDEEEDDEDMIEEEEDEEDEDPNQVYNI